MASRPATPEELRPRAIVREPSRVVVTYYRGAVQLAETVASGAARLQHFECAHQHVTPEAADRCAETLARQVQRKARAEFTPCACHGATPSDACIEHHEPLRFWVDDANEER